MSWLREDTMSILSAGMYTYISNTRFVARHLEEEDIWTLAIRQEQQQDSTGLPYFLVCLFLASQTYSLLKGPAPCWERGCWGDWRKFWISQVLLSSFNFLSVRGASSKTVKTGLNFKLVPYLHFWDFTVFVAAASTSNPRLDSGHPSKCANRNSSSYGNWCFQLGI